MGATFALSQGQDSQCPFCKKGLHEDCIAKRQPFLCCCKGEPNWQHSLSSTVSAPKTLKATIPQGIVAFLDLKSSDTIEWKMQIDNGQKVVWVRKSKTNLEEKE